MRGPSVFTNPRKDPWDQRWYVLTYTIPETQRHLRHRLRQRLTWLGFGRLGPATWISPRDLRPEVSRIAERMGIAGQVDLFGAKYLGLSQARDLVARCWDMEQLNRAYLDFIGHHRPAWQQFVTQASDGPVNSHAAFIQRFLLVHEYRSFPYVDPNLPPELLPNDWLGDEAIHLFQSYAAALAPSANNYVDEVLATKPEG